MSQAKQQGRRRGYVSAHPDAVDELEETPAHTRRHLVEQIVDMARAVAPEQLTHVKRLREAGGLYRTKVKDHRAILARENSEVVLLLVDERGEVYDKLDVAEKRRYQ